MAVPYRTEFEAHTAGCFEALMQAQSFPGSLHPLPTENGLLDIARTLIDQEVSFFTPDGGLFCQLRETGARPARLQDADFVFVDLRHTVQLEELKRGHLLYPDEGATLVLMTRFSGPKVKLTGPGLREPRTIEVDVPPAFWEARKRQIRYPLGWDVFFTDGVQVLGVPRSITAEVV